MKVEIKVSKKDLKRINKALGPDLGPITDKNGLISMIEDLLSGVKNETIDMSKHII